MRKYNGILDHEEIALVILKEVVKTMTEDDDEVFKNHRKLEVSNEELEEELVAQVHRMSEQEKEIMFSVVRDIEQVILAKIERDPQALLAALNVPRLNKETNPDLLNPRLLTEVINHLEEIKGSDK